MTCYRHPKVETSLRCSRCEKPICTDCAVLTPVGYRCRECGKERSATQTLEMRHLIPGLAVAFGLPFGASYLVDRLPIGFFVIFVAAIVGGLVGQLIRKVIAMKSSQLLAVVSIAGYVIGAFALPVSRALKAGDITNITPQIAADPWPLVFAVVAAISTSVQLK